VTRVFALVLLAGCYNPPDVNLVDEVPLVPQGACAPNRVEWVGCVHDGDTFDLSSCGGDAERIRLLGIDAPEVAHEGDPAECGADAARAELRRLADNREVLLTFDEECEGIFGRTLAYVWLDEGGIAEGGPGEDSVLLNEWLLREGFVRLFDEDFGQELRLEDRLVAAESEARARGLGLWSDCTQGAR
jgi:micrococcal nuclease